MGVRRTWNVQWSRILNTLIVSQLVMKFLACSTSRRILSCSLYQTLNRVLKHLNLLVTFYFKAHFSIILLSLFICSRGLREKPAVYAASQGLHKTLEGSLSVHKRSPPKPVVSRYNTLLSRILQFSE
jgi:hypothetical protein